MIKATRPELYPLTAHGLDHREFVQRYQGMLAMFSELSAGAPFPGSSDRMDFSGALLALKAGHHVARDGWYGQGLYVTLQDGYPDGIAINANTAEATGLPEGATAAFEPYLLLHRPAYRVSEHRASFVPWVPSTGDVLAEDWRIAPRPGAVTAKPVDVTAFGANERTRADW